MSEMTGQCYLMKMIVHRLKKQTDCQLKHLNLTIGQARLLGVLHQAEQGSCSMKELERTFHTAQSTVAGTVSRLEKKGLAEGCSDPADRRVKRVRLTQAGREVCEEAWRNMIETEQTMLSQLTPAEQQELLRLLKKVYETLC